MMISAELRERIAAANLTAFSRLKNAEPCWVDWQKTLDAVPGMAPDIILRSGPPCPWKRLTPTQRHGVVNGILFERLADTPAAAERLVLNGAVRVFPGGDFGVVCSGTGIVTASMSVNVVEDRSTGRRGFCAPFEGPNRGGLAGYGMYNSEIGRYLNVMNQCVVPVFSRILNRCGGLDLRPFLARGLEMGDELHIRQDAATLMMTRELLLRLADAEMTAAERRACLEYLRFSPRIFHPLDMAAAMATLQGVRDIEYSTVVAAQCGNGVDFGIKLAGTNDLWFTAPAPRVVNPGAESSAAALPWIGDSCVCEAVGWGAFAAAASPVSELWVGHDWAAALAQTRQMYKISAGENLNFPLPLLNGGGVPCGIDALKVCETGIVPVLHGGRMAPDGSRLGPGLAEVPQACFEMAMKRFVAEYQKA